MTAKISIRPPRPSSRYFQETSQDVGDSKRLRTKALLLDTAIEVFAKKGSEAASILEITEAAGLSNGSFYYHFSDKPALVAEVGRAISSTLVGQTDERMRDVVSGTKRVAFGVMFFIHHAAANPSWGRLISLALDERGLFQEQFLASMRNDIKLAVKQGELQVEPSHAHDAIALGIIRAALHGRVHQPPIDGIDVAAVQTILSMLGASPAKAKSLSKAALLRVAQEGAGSGFSA